MREAGVGGAKTFHAGALKGLRSTSNALQLKDDRMDCDAAELLDENGTEFDVCHAKVNALINSRFPPPVLRALKFKEVRLPSSPTATAPSLPRRQSTCSSCVCAVPHGSLLLGDGALRRGRGQHLRARPPKLHWPVRVRCHAPNPSALHLIDCASAISQISVDR